MTEADSDTVERSLGNRLGINYDLLVSGDWLLRLPTAADLGETATALFLQRIQELIACPHPHLLRILKISERDQGFCILAEAGPTEELMHSASPSLLGLWAIQLCAVARHLQALGFPLGSCFAQPDGLAFSSSGLFVLDPGLAASLQGDADLPAAIEAYGRTLAWLAGDNLPVNLQWVVSRCQAGKDLRYRDFDDVAQALNQGVSVEEPGPVRQLTRGPLPTLSDFQIPKLETARRVPKTRIFLILILAGLILWGASLWKAAPPPARNYPAAAFVQDQQLVLLDLNSGAVRRRLRMPLPAVAVCRVGNFLYVQCRGSHQLHRLDSHTLEECKGPTIDPDPSQMAPDSSGRLLYMLYPRKARALALRLPETPQRYLDLDSGAHLLQPMALAQGRPGLAVANREQDGLKVYGLESGIPEGRSELAAVECMDSDSSGVLWLVSGQWLLELGPDLKVRHRFGLAEPATLLRVVGSRTVCASTAALLVLENGALLRLPLNETPLRLEADPNHPNRVWVLSRSGLTCVDLKDRRRVLSWALSRPPASLTMLP